MLAIYVIIMSLSVIECQDIDMCEYIQTNGTYHGICIHRLWTSGSFVLDYNSYHVMYAKGRQWRVRLEKINESFISVKPTTTPKPLQSISGWKPFDQYSGRVDGSSYLCEVYYTDRQKTRLETQCGFDGLNYMTRSIIQYNVKGFLFSPVVVSERGTPSLNSYIMSMDRNSRSIQVLKIFASITRDKSLELHTESSCRPDCPPRPPFVDQIPDERFTSKCTV